MEDKILVFSGGSKSLGWDTCTSDVDYYVIHKEPVDKNLHRRLNKGELSDIEYMEYSQFRDLSNRLGNYIPNLSGQYPPFNFFELRFIARCLLGKLVFGNPQMLEEVKHIQAFLRPACVSVYCSEWINSYQDAIGLLCDERIEEAILLLGNLTQLAFRLSASQFKLIDPSIKWGYQNLLSTQYVAIHKKTLSIINLLRCVKCHRDGLALLLELNKLIIFSGLIAEGNEELLSNGNADAIGTIDINLCYMGMPKYYVFFHVQNRSFSLSNASYLSSYVATGDCSMSFIDKLHSNEHA